MWVTDLNGETIVISVKSIAAKICRSSLAIIGIALFNCPAFCRDGASDISITPSPTETYLEFHEKMLAASSVDQLSPMFTKSRADQIKTDKEKMPPAQIKAMFNFMQELAPRKVHVLAEQTDGDICMLAVEAPEYKDPILGTQSKSVTKGTIRLIREDGRWKIEKEQWNTSSGADSSK